MEEGSLRGLFVEKEQSLAGLYDLWALLAGNLSAGRLRSRGAQEGVSKEQGCPRRREAKGLGFLQPLDWRDD